MRNYFSVFILCCFIQIAVAQRYILSNVPQLNQKKSIFHRPIGSNMGGLYCLNYAQENLTDGFSIERFDSELGYVQGRFFEVGKKIYVLKIFTTDSGINWISLYRKRNEKTKLYLNSIDLNLEGSVKTKFIADFDLKNIDVNDLYADCSADKKKWSLTYLKHAGDDLTEIGFQMYSFEGNKIFSEKKYVNSRQSSVRLESTILSDSNQFIGSLLVELPRDFGSRGNKNIDLYLLKFSKAFSDVKKIPLSSNYLNSEIMVDAQTQNIYLGGLFGDARGIDIDGCFTVKIPQKEFQTEQLYESKFSEILVKQILGVNTIKRNREMPKNFFFRRMVLTSTGKLVCILEQYSESKQLETYYINGIPQTSTRILYHCGDVLTLFLDTMGQIDSSLVLRKDQTGTMYNLYLMGIGTYVCQDGIHIIYNSDIAKSNEIIDVTIKSNHTMESKVIMSSDQFYNLVIPYDGKEMEYCTFTVPLFRDKQWFWMQITGYD
jgi:hypothetical protein